MYVSPPADRPQLDECTFYHSIELPGLGLQPGQWDLRPSIDSYLGRVDFTGSRALDVGAANGFLSFEMERRGAEVVAVDLPSGGEWDIVPFAGLEERVAQMRDFYDSVVPRRTRAFWLAHSLLGSRAKLHLGSIHGLPAQLGLFDVAMVGMILGHLRDPFGALMSIARRVKQTIIVTEVALDHEGAFAYFMPDASEPHDTASWWATSEDLRSRMLGVLGFELKSCERAPHQHVGGPQVASTQVFQRVRGSAG
jgi:SAM-dependent methyltransferase